MTTLTKTPEIRNIEFPNRSIMFVHLSNERTFIVPLEEFPLIQDLSPEQRNDYEVIDGIHLSFLAINEIFSLSDLTGLKS